MKYSLLFVLLFSGHLIVAQPPQYLDSVSAFRNQYINTHGVIKEKDRAGLQFYPIDTSFLMPSRVERIYEAPWFAMETSGKIKKTFRVYALLHFTMSGKPLRLTVYQSQQLMQSEEYKDYLFIPFTDLSNGEQTYENGRYIDIRTGDLENSPFLLDFNKAYNPYCAYVSNVYNCPVPPVENKLAVPVNAGEKKFSLH
ncbi:MAG TPA: DUF1684 domain-containing protein [Chitinophagaceae bacterium]|nr:DUF1684 domain-containing protein [Chitinophagaceae bacterium]HPH30779.1 DUF1684 domain-containing protein [Chitinophagaceae bacterium]HPN58084.1 DUF1684 domain-containing protein [Chitinophagaceae bacterium]